MIAGLFHLGAEGIERIAYQDTEHYQVTRRFLDDPARMLEVLLGRDDEDA